MRSLLLVANALVQSKRSKISSHSSQVQVLYFISSSTLVSGMIVSKQCFIGFQALVQWLFSDFSSIAAESYYVNVTVEGNCVILAMLLTRKRKAPFNSALKDITRLF